MTTRNDYDGFRRYVAGMQLRNLSPGLPSAVTEENVLDVVRLIADFMTNALPAEIERIGLFINDDGEVERVSEDGILRLQDYFDGRYSQLP
jgi:hypothetical protein